MTIIAETAQAQLNIERLGTAFLNLPKSLNIPVATTMAGEGTVLLPGHASGGPVLGPGTGTSDSIVRGLSNGEHVITAAEVQAAGGHGAVERWRQSVARGGDLPVYTTAGSADMVRSTPAASAGYLPAAGGALGSGTPVAAALPPIEIIVSQKGGIDLLQYIDVAVRQPTDQLAASLRGTR